jgi:4-carboxymuconolactone decarboxylase
MSESGCRVPFITEPAEQDRHIYERSANEGKSVSNLYRALANAPGLLSAWVALAWPLRLSTLTSRALRELMITYLAQRRSCDYVAVHHGRFARKTGVSPQQLDELGEWRESEVYDDVQRAGLQMVDDIVDQGAASNEVVATLQHLLGSDATVELVVTAGFYEAVCVVNRSLDVPLEAWAIRNGTGK